MTSKEITDNAPDHEIIVNNTIALDSRIVGPYDLTSFEVVANLNRRPLNSLQRAFRRHGLGRHFPTFYDFRVEIAARMELFPFAETFSYQIDQALEEERTANGHFGLIHQLSSWGPLTGLVFTRADDVNRFLTYFEHVPNIHADEATSAATGGKVTYGGVFTEMLLRKLTRQESSLSLDKTTAATIRVIRSWRGLALLPRTIINQAGWRIPNPEKTILANIPAMCGKIKTSLMERLETLESTPLFDYLYRICEELERTEAFFKELKETKWEASRDRLPASFRPMATPLIALAQESLQAIQDHSSPDSAKLFCQVASNFVDAFLVGRFGYERDTLDSLISLSNRWPVLTPWVLLELQKRNICQISLDYYLKIPINNKAWQTHHRHLNAIGLTNDVPDNPNAQTAHDRHQRILEQPPKSITVTENSTVFCAPGKFWPPHWRHIIGSMTAARVAGNLFGNACIMVSPNVDDPTYQTMRLECPAFLRIQLFQRAISHTENVFVARGGQTTGVHSNQDKFCPEGNFARYLQRLFRLERPPKVGFVGGMEKVNLMLDGQYPLMPSILFVRYEDLISMPKAIERMEETLSRLEKYGVAIILLPGLRLSGTRVRHELSKKRPSYLKLSAYLHPAVLIELATLMPQKGKILRRAAGANRL